MQFQKIVIGISGGVDSAVAALILRNKGELVITFMDCCGILI